ncbi:MAG: hypothetical protein ACK4ND_15715 [Cytophagaceae bacterium]
METSNKKWYKKFGWFGIIACGLCCALPIIGTLAGIGALTAFGAYFEKIGIVALGIAGILFALHFYQKNKAKKECSTSCDTNCDCKTVATTK